ncbi:T9SS type A sorting domain-containing protein [Brumimicrobium glaciale]|uniref:T9SS type A sorting domain-containing protein n=1 Tax=Brumimicrobium glaciale TaxID=200475 RepID=A0A4Q4KJH2_9FLAO|nr:T9SS type A sorting domain-containing protein [Brumimicrobium glaciale]RYM32414.1 T9SS type A sorting domain-containing protein [Brumimicrobium glaciale]
MKNSLFLLFSLTIGGLFGQQTPEFSFELYFEDAIGNKDTITLGYDELATNGIDAPFGEVDKLNDAWNTTLEARVGDKTYSGLNTSSVWINSNSYLSKKQILNSYCQDIDYPERISIQFTTDNYPIKIKWDKKIFDEDCQKYSFLFGQDDHYHFDATGFLMLRSADSLVIDSSFVFLGRELASYETNGNIIGVLQFVFHRYYNLNIEVNQIDLPNVFPNPINGDYIKVMFEGQYEIKDMTGKIIQKGIIENDRILFHNHQNGIFNLLLFNKSKSYNLKIIKL